MLKDHEVMCLCSSDGATTITKKEEVSLYEYLKSASRRVTYMFDPLGNIAQEDQKQVVMVSMWRALTDGGFNPDKGCSLMTYLVHVGNNAVKTLFSQTGRQVFDQSVIRETEEAPIDRFVPENFYVGGILEDPEIKAFAVKVLLRLVYMFDNASSHVVNHVFGSNGDRTNKTAVAADTGFSPYIVDKILKGVRSRALLLSDLTDTYPMVSLFAAIQAIHAKGFKEGLKAIGTKDVNSYKKSAYFSKLIPSAPPTVTVRACENRNFKIPKIPTRMSIESQPIDWEVFKYLFSDMDDVDLRNTEWCKEFADLAANDPFAPEATGANDGSYLELMYEGYVAHYRRLGDIKVAEKYGDLSFGAGASEEEEEEPKVEVEVEVKDKIGYSDYVDYFKKALLTEGLDVTNDAFPFEVRVNRKSTAFFLQVRRRRLFAYYHRHDEDFTADKRQNTVIKIPILTVYDADTSASKKGTYIHFATAFNLEATKVTSGHLRPSWTRENTILGRNIQKQNFMFFGPRVPEDDVQSMFAFIAKHTRILHDIFEDIGLHPFGRCENKNDYIGLSVDAVETDETDETVED